MKRTSVVFATVTAAALVGGAAFFATQSEPTAERPTATAAANLQTQVFRVEQMTCATCPIAVRTAMAGVVGVASVDVNFETRTATVVFDPAVATPDQIANASTNAGFPASPAS